ncbi:MAG TPA: hypothetical protein P5511_06750 [Candidatus Goldiibacteriota bacterium]|nr:hypothetical protein [Candidatus Goldiibacteriota bacterium]
MKTLNAGIVAAASIAMLLLLAGCQGSLHNPSKARETAYIFLSSVFMNPDFKTAYELVDADFDRNYGSGYLEKLNDRFNRVFSKLEGLKAESYLAEPGDRNILVIFTGISEKALSYHKVNLTGDSRSGYRVSGIVYSDAPFAGYRTLKPFK